MNVFNSVYRGGGGGGCYTDCRCFYPSNMRDGSSPLGDHSSGGPELSSGSFFATSTSGDPAAPTPISADAAEGAKATPSVKKTTGLHKVCTLGAPLADFMGRSQASRVDVTKFLWTYIKKHQLQKSDNRRIILADDRLLALLQQREISMFQLNKVVSKYIQNIPLPPPDVAMPLVAPPAADPPPPLAHHVHLNPCSYGVDPSPPPPPQAHVSATPSLEKSSSSSCTVGPWGTSGDPKPS